MIEIQLYKKYYLFCIIVILLTFSLFSMENQKINWEKVNILWKNYLNYPSDINLNRLCKNLPDSKKIELKSFDSDFIKSVDENISIIGKEVYSGNREAIKICYRLRLILSRKRYGKWKINEILSNLIRIKPKIFLEELLNNKEAIDDYYLKEDILCYFDLNFYVDKVKAKLLETKKRILALKSVDSEALRKVRDKCLYILKNTKKKYEAISKVDL